MNNHPHLHAKKALEIYNYPAVQDDLYVVGHAIAGLISYKKMTIIIVKTQDCSCMQVFATVSA